MVIYRLPPQLKPHHLHPAGRCQQPVGSMLAASPWTSDEGLQQRAPFLGIREGETWISRLVSLPEHVAVTEILLLDTFAVTCCVRCLTDGMCPTPSLFRDGLT